MANGTGNKPDSNKFNTFSGVFLPSILAIFGAVVYYVAPRVLGGVGLMKMILIVLLAHSITMATSFSISAIATNIYVKKGGLYYLISRSLGTEIGGSTGIQLFFAQAISIAFYCIAFAKAVTGILSSFNIYIPEMHITVVAFIVFWIIAFIGAKFVIKLQYIILFTIVLSFASIFMGTNRVPATTEFMGLGGIPIAFWVAFMMFFPAVTGMDAGVSMSGDLKNPRKSLVRGTIWTVLVTMIVYVLLSIKFFYGASLLDLSSDLYIIEKIAYVPFLIILGVLLTTSSSALSYLMAAPRILHALAIDNIFSKRMRWLGNSLGAGDEPRVAMIVTFIIGLGIIMIGDLFFVSQIVAVFFLNVYGWINGAAFLEKVSRNPSFRPSFNPPALVSLYGVVMCYLVMYLFNPLIMGISLLIQFIIFYILLITKASSKIESVWYGTLFQLLRVILRRIEAADKSKKNWRPTIVAFCINRSNLHCMATLLNWITHSTGVTHLYYLIFRSFKTYEKERDKIEDNLQQYVKEYDLEVFSRVALSGDYNETVKSIIQTDTIGNLPLNTMLIDFDERLKMEDTINNAKALRKNVIVLRNRCGFSNFKRIDVWWRDHDENGNMMMLLAHLITHSTTWKKEEATIRLFKVVKSEKEYKEADEELSKNIEDARIDNLTYELIFDKKTPVKDLIVEKSQDTDLVILGLPKAGKDGKTTKGVVKEIKKHTDRLKMCMLVSSSEHIDLTIT